MALFNLYNLFYNDVSKRAFISRVGEGFKELYEAAKPYTPLIIHGPIPKPKDDSDKDFRPPTAGVNLGAILKNTTTPNDYISPEFNYNTIQHNIFWAISEATSSHALTWIVLSLLYVCPESRKLVEEQTEPTLAIPYFEKFEERFEFARYGILIHKTDRKEERSCLNVAAKTPLSYLLDEILFFDFIRSSAPIHGAA